MLKYVKELKTINFWGNWRLFLVYGLPSNKSPVPAWPSWSPRVFPAPVLPARAHDLKGRIPIHLWGWKWTGMKWIEVDGHGLRMFEMGFSNIICLSIAIPNTWNHQLDYDKVSWKLLGKQVCICRLNEQGQQISSHSLHTLVATMRMRRRKSAIITLLGRLYKIIYIIFEQQGPCRIGFLISEVPPNNPLQSVIDITVAPKKETCKVLLKYWWIAFLSFLGLL